VELAAQYMLMTDASLSDIALRCGFSDQPHLSKHFRQATGQTPAAWRRAQHHDEYETPPVACAPLGTYQGFTDQVVLSRTPGAFRTVLVPRGSSKPEWLA
jgi:AraC-like DNA-binding protein